MHRLSVLEKTLKTLEIRRQAILHELTQIERQVAEIRDPSLARDQRPMANPTRAKKAA